MKSLWIVCFSLVLMFAVSGCTQSTRTAHQPGKCDNRPPERTGWHCGESERGCKCTSEIKGYTWTCDCAVKNYLWDCKCH